VQKALYATDIVQATKFGVIGSGQMGGGIAQVAAASGMSVKVVDISEDVLKRAEKFMGKLLQKNVDKGKITEQDRTDTLGRITWVTDMTDLADCNFVVEAATEHTDTKLSLFSSLSKIVDPATVMASNTSSISITKIAGATERPDKVIGMHFMNPVQVMKLVEVIPGLQSSDETLQQTLDLARAMGKTTTTSQDRAGFIANRILMPYINEAIFALMEGVGTPEDIDTTMKFGTNVPMGPLTLADFIGLDTCLAIMRVLHTEMADSKYRPCPLLVKYVEAGWYGKKSGKGFYDYAK